MLAINRELEREIKQEGYGFLGVKDRKGMVPGFTSIETNQGDRGEFEGIFDSMYVDIVDKVSGGDDTFIIKEVNCEDNGRFGVFEGSWDESNFDFMFETRLDELIEGFFMHDNKLRVIGSIGNHFNFDIVCIVEDGDRSDRSDVKSAKNGHYNSLQKEWLIYLSVKFKNGGSNLNF